MNVVWGFVVIALAVVVAVASLLFVRRRAPEGGYFEDGDRAAGVFGVLATGFSILLGFIVFLAFESYDQSRTGAEQEALVLVQQVENAQFFPPASRARLTGELVCYGRSVVNGEWDRMRAGTSGDADQPVGRQAVPLAPGGASRRSRPSRPPTTRGATRPRRERRRAWTASTAPRV